MSSLKKLQIFALGHNRKSFDHTYDFPHLTKINLNDLVLPIENTNDLAENRFFLLPESYFEDCPEYIGVLTAQYNKKYPDLLRLRDLHILQNKCNKSIVWAASPTENFNDGKWIEHSCDYHKTLKPYLLELSEFTSIPLVNNPTLYANNFICHKTVFLDFIRFFKNVFAHFNKKYGYNFDIHVDDPTRRAAYFYERVAMIYFSSRKNLHILKIPDGPKFNLDNILWIASSASNYEPLTKIWHNSLINIGVKNENLRHNIIDNPEVIKDKSVVFQSDTWFYSLEKKMYHFVNELKNNINNEQYKYFISTDCDIRYFPDKLHVWKILIDYVDNHDFDIFFQPENQTELNCGFMIIKKEKLEIAIKFFEFVLKTMQSSKKEEMPLAEQTIVRNNIKKINACVLPSACCVAGPFYDPKNKDIYLFHHAICAYNLEMKLLQIEYIEKLEKLV